MNTLHRRNLLAATAALTVPAGLLAPLVAALPLEASTAQVPTQRTSPTSAPMQIQYLELVSPDAEILCNQYAAVHGLTFSEPDTNLGGARTAKLPGGGLLGIRPPLRDSETPVVRPYALVADIKAAVTAAAAAGAEVALTPMKLPGHGTCAIVVQGGIECGLWQVE